MNCSFNWNQISDHTRRTVLGRSRVISKANYDLNLHQIETATGYNGRLIQRWMQRKSFFALPRQGWPPKVTKKSLWLNSQIHCRVAIGHATVERTISTNGSLDSFSSDTMLLVVKQEWLGRGRVAECEWKITSPQASHLLNPDVNCQSRPRRTGVAATKTASLSYSVSSAELQLIKPHRKKQSDSLLQNGKVKWSLWRKVPSVSHRILAAVTDHGNWSDLELFPPHLLFSCHLLYCTGIPRQIKSINVAKMCKWKLATWANSSGTPAMWLKQMSTPDAVYQFGQDEWIWSSAFLHSLNQQSSCLF